MLMSNPSAEPPPIASRAPPTRNAPKGTPHHAAPGETWGSLAQQLGIDPWELIDFNFPGMLRLKQRDVQQATRQVNWYLANYVGCWESTDGGKNYAFGSTYKGGMGDYANGMIFLPPRTTLPVPPAPPGCTAIQIPAVDFPPTVLAIFELAKVKVPKSARCLSAGEVTTAKAYYGNSLDYDRIYISDGLGASNRPVTVALPVDGRWIVVLNVGPYAYANPNAGSQKATLIHELAHAWQSQHHPKEPMRFMMNCALCQAAAAAATAAAAVNSNRWVRLVTPGVPDFRLGPADAYSYVPGKPFGDYGGEQIAQQVEDTVVFPRPLSPLEITRIALIPSYMASVPAGVESAENVRSLSRHDRYAHKSFPGVVWHD
jgi:hypothetical protein